MTPGEMEDRSVLTREDRSLFISSCSRREMARRRPSRPLPPLAVAAIALLVAIAATGAALLAAGAL